VAWTAVCERERLVPICEKIRSVGIVAEGGSMAYVIEMPVEGGGLLRVQGPEEDVPADLEPAPRREPSAQAVEAGSDG